MDLNITILDILVIWLGNRLLDYALKAIASQAKTSSAEVKLGGKAEVDTTDPSKCIKTCHNCWRASFTMYAENKCPYCDHDRMSEQQEQDLIAENRAQESLDSIMVTGKEKWNKACPACGRSSYTMNSDNRCPYCTYDGHNQPRVFDANHNMSSVLAPPKNVCDYPSASSKQCVHPL